MTTSRLSGVVIAILSLSAMTGAAEAGEATGLWLRANGASKIKIEDCGGALCGTVAWERAPRKDVNNPDAARRDEPLLGRRVLIGLKPTGKPDQWKGEVYNADDGKTYTGYAQLQSVDTLELKGCVLGGLICKSDVWSRTK